MILQSSEDYLIEAGVVKKTRTCQPHPVERVYPCSYRLYKACNSEGCKANQTTIIIIINANEDASLLFVARTWTRCVLMLSNQFHLYQHALHDETAPGLDWINVCILQGLCGIASRRRCITLQKPITAQNLSHT